MGENKYNGGFGTRNLVKFNMALLAKQGWRPISNLTLLLPRVLKDIYF